MIPPTIGRVVLVYCPESGNQWEPALITYVHSQTLINATGFGRDSVRYYLSIELRQDPVAEDPIFHKQTGDQIFACWMPYQRQAAAR